MSVDPAARERAVAALLDAWPWHLGGIIIGGYVNAAYGKPRYSNDIDVVVPVKNLQAHLDWLHGRDPPFSDVRVPDDLEQNYAGKTARFAQGDITLDLLPGGVMDREANVHIPESWIAQKPRTQRLLLLDASTSSDVPVCRPEAFWALKLQAGRSRDIGDLFANYREPVDLAEVAGLFTSLWCESLADKLSKVRVSLEDPKTYHDAVGAAARGSPKAPQNRASWDIFKGMVSKAVPNGGKPA